MFGAIFHNRFVRDTLDEASFVSDACILGPGNRRIKCFVSLLFERLGEFVSDGADRRGRHFGPNVDHVEEVDRRLIGRSNRYTLFDCRRTRFTSIGRYEDTVIHTSAYVLLSEKPESG